MPKKTIGKIVILIGFLYSNIEAIECYWRSAAKESDEKEQKITIIPTITTYHPFFYYYDQYPLHCSNTSFIYRASTYYDHNKMLGLSRDIIVLHESNPLYTALIPTPALNTRLLGISDNGNFIAWKNNADIYVRNAHGMCKAVPTDAYSYDTVCFSPNEELLAHSMQKKITVFNLKKTKWNIPEAPLKKEAYTFFHHETTEGFQIDKDSTMLNGTIRALQIDKDNKTLIGHIPENHTVLICPLSLKQHPQFVSYSNHEKLQNKSRILKLLPDGTIAIIARNGEMSTCNTNTDDIYFKEEKKLPIPPGLRLGIINFLHNNYALAILQNKNSISPWQMVIIKNKEVKGRWYFWYTECAGISPNGKTMYTKSHGYVTKFKTRDLLRSIMLRKKNATKRKKTIHYSDQP